jgi:hypothetical protein
MNCSSLCARERYAKIVSAMDSAGKISHAPDRMRDWYRAAAARREAAPMKLSAEQGAASRTGGDKANPPRKKIKRSHRAAAERSSIGRLFRRRFSAGEGFREAIAEATRHSEGALVFSPVSERTPMNRQIASRRFFTPATSVQNDGR